MRLPDLIALARPWQWSKNGIVFAGLVFSEHLFHPEYILRSLAAFVIYCLASSSIYVINDIFDLERDRLHPVKRERPLPAGRIGLGVAWGLGLVLTAGAFAAMVPMGWASVACLAVFLTANFTYSVWLKNLVLVDVMMIAISFVIRAIAGVLVLRPLEPGLEISPWLLLCTFFLALFLALGKRRNELLVLEGDAAGHRNTLGQYSRDFLDQLMGIVSAATLIAYAIYTIAPGTVSKFHSPWLVFTLPFVTFGIFRYLYLIRMRGEGGQPARTLYQDIPILLTTLGWLVTAVVVIYFDGP